MRVVRGLQYLGDGIVRLPWPPPTRSWLLRRLGARIDAGARVHRCSFINLEATGFRGLTIGRGAHIGPECMFDMAQPITIGERATLSPRVTVLTHADPGNSAVAREHPRQSAPVVVEADAWIGTGAVILCGVTIGERAIVGAGAVVRSSVAPGITVAGVPARPIGERTSTN